MLGVNPTQPFLPGHPQPQGPPPQQPNLPGHPNMAFMSNHPGSAPPLLSAQGPQGLGSTPFPSQLRQANAQRNATFVQQPHNGQPFNPQIPGSAHINGMGHPSLNQFATPGMPPVRRPPPQGPSLNPAMSGLGQQPAVGTVPGMPGAHHLNGQGMNGFAMAGGPQLRQGPSGQMRMPSMMQGQPHLQDMNMNSLHQAPQIRGPVGMIPGGVSRAASHTFASSGPPHSGGMQPGFPTQMNHAQNPMAHSPHISPPHSAGPMGAPQLNHSASMPSLPSNRPRMTPENGPVMAGLPHGGPPQSRLQTISSSFHYLPNQSQNNIPSPSHMPGPSSQPVGGSGGLVNTPAQTLQQQLTPEYSFNGPTQPPQANALRPPSQLSTHPTPMPGPEMPHNQAQQPPAMPQLPRPPSVARQSPFQERRAGSVQGQRPPSRAPSLHNAQSPQHAAQPPRTPRMSQPPAGVPSLTSQNSAPGTGPQQTGPPPPSSNPEEQNPNVAGPSYVHLQTQRPGPQSQPVLPPMPPAQRPVQSIMIPNHNGVTRMLAFSGGLATESPERLQMSYWESLVNSYFSSNATFKFTLWKDNQRTEAKPFEIGVPILPRFFLVTSQSGVKTMHLNLDGARERTATHFGRPAIIVECSHAIWTFRYANGYVVTLRGPLTATLSAQSYQAAPGPVTILKFDTLSFDASHHDKTISLDAIIGNRITDSPNTHTPRQTAQTTTVNGTDPSQASHPPDDDPANREEPRVIVERAIMPAEPVNAFGIPQATMRCLELAESVAQMSDLILFSKQHELGPRDALTRYAKRIREGHHVMSNGSGPMLLDDDVKPFILPDHSQALNAASPAYMGTPAQSHSQPPQPTSNGPQVGPDVKTTKSSLAQAQASVSSPSSGPTSATTPAASTPGASVSSSTPLQQHATLKRKAQADTASPTTTHDAGPPAKRTNRKRGKTQGG